MLEEKKPMGARQDVQAEDLKGDHSDRLEAKGDAESDSAVVVDGEDRTNLFVWLLVACSSISGLLFGALFIPTFSQGHSDMPHRRRQQVTTRVSSLVRSLPSIPTLVQRCSPLAKRSSLISPTSSSDESHKKFLP